MIYIKAYFYVNCFKFHSDCGQLLYASTVLLENFYLKAAFFICQGTVEKAAGAADTDIPINKTKKLVWLDVDLRINFKKDPRSHLPVAGKRFGFLGVGC